MESFDKIHLHQHLFEKLLRTLETSIPYGSPIQQHLKEEKTCFDASQNYILFQMY